jgi:hypothetical protein
VLPLDDDVGKYVAELSDYRSPILLLIYHTSGIRDYITLAEHLTDFRIVDRTRKRIT